MSTALPPLDLRTFERRLAAASGASLPAAAVAALFSHYQELGRWSPTLSLVGPGDAGHVVERHYAEALAALPWLPEGEATLVDVGSGAGFPGFVLAAARPDLDVLLVEPRERRWAFLSAAVRKAGLARCRCLCARVETPLPAAFPERLDVVTARALRLPPDALSLLMERLGVEGRFLLFLGETDPELPRGLRVSRAQPLGGARVRRLVEISRETRP